jgi:phosphoribosylformimino-5-aminoimidazole carboxamide ribotide isomerase
MLIIPAIDLHESCVVRFVQGKLNKKVYSRDAVKTAKHWVKQGADMLHVVDLDGAFTGVPANIEIVKQIAREAGVPVECGGGVRSMDAIRTLLESGVQRVILGTRAAKDEAFVKQAFKEFGERVIISIDAKDDYVAVEGWHTTDKSKDVITFANALKGIGFTEVIYTDTMKDGTLKGPNIAGTKRLLKETGLRVVASGGMSSIQDVRKIKALEKDGVTGVIIGKALYEGKFTLAEALKVA